MNTIVSIEEEGQDTERQLVTMLVGQQMFGIPILKVQDIVEPTCVTPVPLAPAAIAGVLNLRGRIVTVVDLRPCLQLPPKEHEKHHMGITVEYNGDLYTLLVDDIGDVCSLSSDELDQPPPTLSESMKRVCTGIVRLPDRLLIVLDVEKVLAKDTIENTACGVGVWQEHRRALRKSDASNVRT